MRLDEILQAAGRHKRRKRIGRGEGSGRGKTSGRGNKGKGQRAGSRALYGFEGGQNPILKRIPKRGFNNANFRRTFQVVNVGDLERFQDGQRVDAQTLAGANLIRPGGGPVKILGAGCLGKKLTVAAEAFSKAAESKIAAAGGGAERT